MMCSVHSESVFMLDGKSGADSKWLDSMRYTVNDEDLIKKRIPNQVSGGKDFLAGIRVEHCQDDIPKLFMMSVIPIEHIKDFAEMQIYLRLMDDPQVAKLDEYKSHWNGFLRLCNVFQFLNNIWFVSSQGLDDGLYNSLEFVDKTEEVHELSDKVLELMDLVDEDDKEIIFPILTYCDNKNLPLPEIGCEILGVKRVEAEVMVGWPQLKACCLLKYEMEEERTVKDLGWNTVLAVKVLPDLSILEGLLKGN